MKLNNKVNYLISRVEIGRKVRNIKIDMDNLKCHKCGKPVNEGNYIYDKGLYCSDCYNIKRESTNYCRNLNDYCHNELGFGLTPSDFIKLKTVLLDKGYTYKQILFTFKYLYEISNSNNKSIGLVYYYIDKAITYAKDNNINLETIPSINYFENQMKKHTIEIFKLATKRGLRKEKEDDIIREYTKVESITEEQLEDYMITHLDLIEDSMKYICRQKPIKNGIIDIGAKDKNNISCIIELKNNDKCNGLKRQCKEYPESFRNNNIPFRMISLTTGYDGDVFDVINKIGYVEMYQYDIEYGNLNNPIKQLKIKRVN